MAEAPANLCPHCGVRSVRKQARAGRIRRHRMLSALDVPANFLIPTCGRCGYEEIDLQTATELGPLMAAAFNEELRRRFKRAVDEICQHISQRQLEKRIGISPGYLSRLHSIKGTPSPTLVALLTLLAHDPRQRLRDLERAWAEPAPNNGHASPQPGEPDGRSFPERGA